MYNIIPTTPTYSEEFNDTKMGQNTAENDTIFEMPENWHCQPESVTIQNWANFRASQTNQNIIPLVKVSLDITR